MQWRLALYRGPHLYPACIYISEDYQIRGTCFVPTEHTTQISECLQDISVDLKKTAIKDRTLNSEVIIALLPPQQLPSVYDMGSYRFSAAPRVDARVSSHGPLNSSARMIFE